MAIALNNTIKNFKNRLVSGQLGQFFKWWGGELRDALPARMRAQMQYARRRLVIQEHEGEIALSVDDGSSVQALDAFATSGDVQLQQQQVRELLQQHELTQVSRDLLLPEEDILRIESVMPLAAEANLRQALSYEMDKHTPFPAAEVFFTWKILQRDREANHLHFELFVTPREPVEEVIKKLKPLGLAPTGIDMATADGYCGINLLPEALRARVVNERTRTNWLVAGAAAVLLVLVMAQSLWLRKHQVNEVNQAIEDVRAEAMAVQQIRKQIVDASEAASFLEVRRKANGFKIEMLAELSRVLPSDTYLDRLSLNSDDVQMQGKSDNAQSLIELINNSDLFSSASFRGPTRLDNRSDKEIFDLSSSLSSGGAN
jgi:general secretion pathway protein L